MKGQIPDELVKEAKGGEVNVDMEDHRDEEFVKPKVIAKPFTGAGNVLGSIAPSVAAPEASANLDPAAAEKSAQQTMKLSEDGSLCLWQTSVGKTYPTASGSAWTARQGRPSPPPRHRPSGLTTSSSQLWKIHPMIVHSLSSL